jgi:ABC-type antimicrobial peptide transport system permease subunit
MFHYSPGSQNVFLLKINPTANAQDAVKKIEEVFKKVNPNSPFVSTFVDDDYAKKFGNERRVGELATFFAILAVLISCLGLFGLASFVAEQRTKEIGIRKVLGASVPNLWRMLSQDFVVLVLISSFIAVPLSYYFTKGWLQQYDYRTEASWWIFVASVSGALVITLLTVSYQAIRASLMNPVNSLRSE